ncbi:formate-dependent phosphoribosylglycinamide formyltransferase [Prochlorococcus marinus]|uniref:formate-dependent phosphoribosylglycinamide formyltransferase n=1 Tax=Prochlorococcus marinus TaxID=1219 RepID=UPI0022B2CAFB|nr:formate-dependent phosphoribosylglycinamide formyltransferase [Prochlorococcus marinus]
MNIFPKTLMLLGSGELGKEVAIAAKRLGCKVIACDRYKDAPAMQVADHAIVFEMNNKDLLQKSIRQYRPDAVIPEIEALAVEALQEIEEEGINVIPTARATAITMNRDKIRNLASETLNVKTAKYAYASNIEELKIVSRKIKYPLLIKPVMSSSGKGQSKVDEEKYLEGAWESAIRESRGKSKHVIVEEFINFDQEITLLTIKQRNGPTLFCPPIGHEQEGGDYQCSWQPQVICEELLKEMKTIAKTITNELGGAGLFGVEFFIRGNEVIFSELSPRPHDTGLVTLISQNLSEFELHLRAILALPIPEIKCISPSASRVILSTESLSKVVYKGIENALAIENTSILIFGKPIAKAGRRMGVSLAKAETIKKARDKADKAAAFIEIFKG